MIFELLLFTFVGLFILYLKKKKNFFSVYTFISLFLGCMLYYVIIPVEISFTQNQLIWAGERFNFISNETLSKSVLFAILSLLGYYFSSKLYPIRVYQTDFKKIDLNYFNTTSIIIITALLYIIFFSDELLNSVSSYRGNVVNKFENSIFSFYSDFLVIFYSITGCYLRIKSKKFNFLVGFYLVLEF